MNGQIFAKTGDKDRGGFCVLMHTPKDRGRFCKDRGRFYVLLYVE